MGYRSKVIVSGMIGLPIEVANSVASIGKLVSQNRVTYRVGQDASIKETINLSSIDDTHIWLPRSKYKHYIDKCRVSLDNRLTFHRNSKPYPCDISPRDEKQRLFMNSMLETLLEPNKTRLFSDAQAIATTGSGKTVSSIWAISQLGCRTLVICHTDYLIRQWVGVRGKRSGLRCFMPDGWVDDHVGIVKQDVCDYDGKGIVVASLSSLYSRDYGAEFYGYFSTIIIDECHRVSAPRLHKAILPFTACCRIGLTATHRKGALSKVLDSHIGKPSIFSTQEVLTPNAYVIRFSSNNTVKYNRYNRANYLTWVSRDKDRNRFIAKLVKSRCYDRGRRGVVMSDRIDQLYELKSLLMKEGVPHDDIGIFVGSMRVDKWQVVKGNYRSGFIYDSRDEAKKAARESHLKGHRIVRKTRRPTAEEVDENSTKRIVLATYQVFGTGGDIPDLSVGFEATPRMDQFQSIGRILRIKKDKPTPEWYSIYDYVEPELLRGCNNLGKQYYTGTVKSLSKHGASIKRVSRDLRHRD